MGVVELSGLPPVGEVVEAWVSIAWVSVWWDGLRWHYMDGRFVEHDITHWKPLAGVKVRA